MQARRQGDQWGGWSNEPIQSVSQSVNKPSWSLSFVPGPVLGAEDRPRVKGPCCQGAPGVGLWGRGGVGSITSNSAFYVNLRSTTKTSCFLLSFPLIAPKGQVGTMLTFLRAPRLE